VYVLHVYILEYVYAHVHVHVHERIYLFSISNSHIPVQCVRAGNLYEDLYTRMLHTYTYIMHAFIQAYTFVLHTQIAAICACLRPGGLLMVLTGQTMKLFFSFLGHELDMFMWFLFYVLNVFACVRTCVAYWYVSKRERERERERERASLHGLGCIELVSASHKRESSKQFSASVQKISHDGEYMIRANT
jgi:hypothetical protein